MSKKLINIKISPNLNGEIDLNQVYILKRAAMIGISLGILCVVTAVNKEKETHLVSRLMSPLPGQVFRLPGMREL